MLSTRRARLAVLLPVAVAVVAVPAVAHAAAPRNGYYIEPRFGVYVQVARSGTLVREFQASCMITPDGGGAPTQQGGFVIRRSLPISARGSRFSYEGRTTLQGYSATKIDVRVAGQFKNGKATGTITFDARTSYCEKVTFSGRFYGLNPQG